MLYEVITGTTMSHGKRHPTVGDRVVIGAGAKILGALYIGSDSRIGANAVVVVITSYSIHYTKLYETPALRPRNFKHEERFTFRMTPNRGFSELQFSPCPVP